VVGALTDVTMPLGGTWSSAHTIVFASLWSVLEQVPDGSGGVPQALTRFQAGENSHVWPSAAGSGESTLFVVAGPDSRAIAVQRGTSDAHQAVLPGQGIASPGYVSSGHLIYREGGNLMAVPFDLERARVGGDAALAVPHVLQYAVSDTGTLAYASGDPPRASNRLVWVSRSGKSQVIDERADDYYQPRLDPVRDDRVVMDRGGQVWMFDLATHNLTPFTFGDRNQHAVWTRDGERLAFMTQKDQTWQLSVQVADGSGKPERLSADCGVLDIPYSLTPDGSLAYVKYSGTAPGELWILPMRGPASTSEEARRLFEIPLADADAGPVFSPDGRWLAYAAADASGRRQIYVQSYPGPGGKHQLSIDGGNEPMWNPDPAKRPLELFYRNRDEMMAVEISAGPGFAQGKPHRLFSGAAYEVAAPNYVRANYDVSRDGSRFLMLQSAAEKPSAVNEIHVVLNWSEELRRIAPPRH
jgi:hypothetical protein